MPKQDHGQTWLRISPELAASVRYDELRLARGADGGLVVNDETVVQQAEFPGGVIALITEAGVALVRRDELERR